ncbi:hypothetical protein [Paraliomyxa miuraensis]|uniref:hypothetical protein n=1 Tax=Paraliomyxa miuraensis TaxID=376150 RepID=UPI00225BBE77|nr:hypothetical protein [Paraliomyxa miuraensis]MCX4242884.1 hypothetical protein [Paraliomyxa miuraensis]
MAQLSDEELREAAAEAGISPHELRHALAERDSSGLARPEQAGSLMGPPDRGASAAHAEGRLAHPPAQALAAVRASIERQTGRTGHRQGEHEADVVDDDLGLNYRVRAQDDGAGGALVRVDVDPTSGRSARNLALTGVVGVTLAMVGLAVLVGSTTLLLGGVGLGVLGGLLVGRKAGRLQRGLVSARAIASHALMEAEDQSDGPRGALPPAR